MRQNTTNPLINTLKTQPTGKSRLPFCDPFCPSLLHPAQGQSPLPGLSGWGSASAEAHQFIKTKAKNARSERNRGPLRLLRPWCRSPSRGVADERGHGATPAVHCDGVACLWPHKVQIQPHRCGRVKQHRRFQDVARAAATDRSVSLSKLQRRCCSLNSGWSFKTWDSRLGLICCKHTLPTLKRWRKHSLQTRTGKWMRTSPAEFPAHKHF